ncbi:MAG: UbiD family decarboxylase [Myxococcota bacterium]
MSYRSTREVVDDLERNGHLVRISAEMEPDLEMAEVHRRVFQAGGPALLFERVKGSPFPAVSNLYGSSERTHFLFRHTLEKVKRVVELRADPRVLLRNPLRYLGAPFTALTSLPMQVGSPPVAAQQTTIDQLPAIRSWPMDGGAYVLLPQVFTEDPDKSGMMNANVGMYRVQLTGNEWTNDRIGLHYQIHRGIGIHHTAAMRRNEPLKVSIFVGGPPAHAFAAVMPLPEGLSELVFGGMLAGRRFRWSRVGGHVLSAEADFCIVGTVNGDETGPEGPFGDHLGYYSLTHDFPAMRVERVYHRKDAIWPFTIVGRPPQEDSYFGELIGELVRNMVPVSLPGVHATHAVDVAGVHPLLLAIGSERYMPYGERMPRELLTQANAILGFNQASLAKFLLITAHQDNPDLDIHDLPAFFRHLLERFDPSRDLHFQTRTTIDTLDYSGTGLNEGSKLVIAAAGPPQRTLGTERPTVALPSGFKGPAFVMPGVLAVGGPAWEAGGARALASALAEDPAFRGLDTAWPWVVLVDDPDDVSKRLRDFLWVTFTRTNPSHDIFGVDETIEHKHWMCRGSMVLDARIKPHHAPPLVEDPDVTRRVDALGAAGGPLHGII